MHPALAHPALVFCTRSMRTSISDRGHIFGRTVDAAEARTATASSPTRSAHTSTNADASAATISARSRREPQPSRVGPLPSDLPDTSRSPRAESREHDARGERCTKARHDTSTADEAPSTRRGRPCSGRVSRASTADELRARDAEGHARGRVRRASTADEHIDLVVFDHVSANAPGWIEGRCEHTDLSINTDATIATVSSVTRSTRRAETMTATASSSTRSVGVAIPRTRDDRHDSLRHTVDAQAEARTATAS